MNRLALAAALLAAASATAAAQTAPPSPPPPTTTPTDTTPATETPPHGEVRTIGLAEAISLATGQNVQISIHQETIESARDKLRGDKTYRLPSFSITGGLQVWDQPFKASLAKGMPKTEFRPQVTASVTGTIAEAVTAAALLKTLLKLDEAGVDAAEADLATEKLDLAYQAAEAYLNALQVDTLHELATTSMEQIDANLTKAKALRDAKVLADVDVLRLEAARDAAEQQVLDAETNGVTARAGLALLLGLPDGAELALAPLDLTPPDLTWTEDEAVAAAKSQRPERRAAQAHIEQASRGVDLVKGNYLPMVSAVIDYTHNEQGLLAESDSGFIGLNVSWNIWDWGKRKADLDAAKSAKRQADAGAKALDDAIAFDVRAKYRTAVTKKKSLDVSESGLKAAEEAYRLQQVKITAGAATTTDVIDAESDVSRARAQATIARYQYLIAWMALVRAVGQLPDVPAAK